MKRIIGFALLSCLLFAACSNDVNPPAQHSVIDNPAEMDKNTQPDTVYMPTGFYFVREGQNGVKMREDKTRTIYTLSPEALASVANVVETKLERTPGEKGNTTELCMTFDAKGTEDLKQGTGNPVYPKIAAVVANKLLFVVKNKVSIKTGVMCVALVGFSDQEMTDMQHAVDLKK